MTNANRRNELTKKIYEFIRERGCATIKEIANAVGVSPRKAYTAIRALFTRKLVLPYRHQVGRERMYCIPDIGDKLYGRQMRSSNCGMICVTLPIEVIEAVDKIAMSTGQTRSNLVKRALIELIDNYFREDGQQQLEDIQHNDWRNQPEYNQEDEEPDFIVPVR